MNKRHPFSALILLGAMAVSLILPPGHAAALLAPVPIAITDIWSRGDLQLWKMPEGDAIDVGTEELYIDLDHTIDVRTVGPALHVTNSEGEVQFWGNADMDGYGNSAHIAVSHLTVGETYTITLKGGPDGILTDKGEPMAADLTTTVHVVPGTFNQTGMRVSSQSHAAGTLANGGTVPRDMTELDMEFNRTLKSTSTPPVTVTDSHGKDPGWWITATSGNGITFSNRSGPLPANETYTITVKGGPDGLLSETGIPLSGDVVFTLHTDDAPVRQSVTIQTNWSKYREAETELYHIQAAAGQLTIQTAGWPAGSTVAVTLKDPVKGTVLFDKQMDANAAAATVDLPAAGTYDLMVRQAAMGSITLTGMDVQAPAVTPAIKLPAMKQFETHNDPFTFAAGLYNPGSAASVQVNLNDKVLVANALQSDGTIAPVAIDPTKLADGLYSIHLTAAGEEGSSEAFHGTWILVDRVGVFSDVDPSQWARHYIDVLYYWGVIKGRDSTHFAPGQPVTRAEFAKMMVMTLGLPLPLKQISFADVPDDWSHPYLQAMYEAGLLKGDVVNGQTYLYPSRPISRAEAATLIGRAVGIADGTAPATDNTFTDYAQVPTWARLSVLVLAKAKWISGFPDGSFGPSGPLQRDQAARILANFVGLQ